MAKDVHLKAASEHENAAKAHRMAAEQSGKPSGLDQPKKAHECSNEAHKRSTDTPVTV